MTRIDLHTHTHWGSGCSVLDVEALVRDAIDAGLDAIVITDHDCFAAADEAERVSRETAFPIFVGVEISAVEGHILCYGARGDVSRATGNSVLEFGPRLTAQGGALVAAHPIRPGCPRTVADAPSRFAGVLSAWEGFNGNCDEQATAESFLIARKAGIPLCAGSDAHTPGRVGWAWTEFADEIRSDADLAEAIRSGRFRPVCGEPVLLDTVGIRG